MFFQRYVTQRGARGDFVNLKICRTQYFGVAHRGRVCVSGGGTLRGGGAAILTLMGLRPRSCSLVPARGDVGLQLCSQHLGAEAAAPDMAVATSSPEVDDRPR